MARADPLPERVAQPGGGRPGQRERKPRAELTLCPRIEIAGISMRCKQAGLQSTQRIQGQRVGQWMAARRQQRLDGVIDRPNPGWEP